MARTKSLPDKLYNIKAGEFKPAKSGTSKDASDLKRYRFVEAYITNGENGLQAAIAAGYSPRSAGQQANRMLKDTQTISMLAERRKILSAQFELRTEDVIRELARIVYADPRKAFDENGVLLPVNKWPDEVAAMVASVEVDALFEGSGEDRVQIGYTQKFKMWDKNAAIEKAMKHLGQYELDNRQRNPIQDMNKEQLERFIERKQKELTDANRLH